MVLDMMKTSFGNPARMVTASFAAIALAACAGTSLPRATGTTAQSFASRPSAYLYAATLDWNTGSGSVFVYDAYGANPKPIKTLAISPGFSEGLWTDSRGNVYVSVVNAGATGLGYVKVYTPGLGKVLRTYTSGLAGPSGGAFDTDGNMYVANLCGTDAISCSVFARTRLPINSSSGYIGVYKPGSMKPGKYLQGPLNIPVGVTVDAKKNVFANNNTGGYAWNVVEFPGGSPDGHVVPFKGFPKDQWVGSVTIDPKDALVAGINSTIDFFANDQGKPARVLTKGVFYPDGLAYGPDGTLFAGNYEFEENEGNTIAFPPGSNAPARSYAVPYNNGVTSVVVGSAE